MTVCKPEFSAGALNKRIIFESLTLTPNDSGGQDEAWSTFATVWASITPKIYREFVMGQRQEPRTVQHLVMRYMPGILTSMRIDYQGRKFHIKSLINLNENDEWIQIFAEEGVGS